MFTRKSVFVALIVFAMLAMIVPAASAAPEWTHGVTIDSPTKAAPVYLDQVRGDKLDVNYSLNIVGTQVHDVHVTVNVYDQYGVALVIAPNFQDVQAKDLKPGLNPEKLAGIVLPTTALDGWYDLEVCAQDLDEVGAPQGPQFCVTEKMAIALDSVAPVVTITKPAINPLPVWVTGQKYELFGIATDAFPGKIVRAWFEYQADPNDPLDFIPIGNENAAGLGTDAKPVAGQPGNYMAVWNSTAVPDNTGNIRFCATDEVKHTTCSVQSVTIENRKDVTLVAGWNLISTPLMLYTPNVADALLHHLVAGGTVDKVYAYDNAAAKWSYWTPAGPDGLKTIDHGKGYWVHVTQPDTLTFVGTWMDETFDTQTPQVPPQYAVGMGWNLIGYTHWGTPTDQGLTETVQSYLGTQLSPAVESMWGYNAVNHVYYQLNLASVLDEGAGYWLALAQAGSINP